MSIRHLPESGYFWLALAMGVLLLGVVLTVCFWGWLHPEGSATVSNSETLRNVGLLVGGALAFVFAGWRAWVAEQEKTTARLQAETAQRQAEIAQQSLLNERYEQGSSRLGSDNLTVRIDGIDMLECLAREHPSGYHVQVIKRLNSFVRASVSSHRLPEEIRAAMEAIGSRSEADIRLENNESFELNLGGSDLRNAYLAHLNLSGANLMHADLSGAVLWGADLSNARLLGANLKNAMLFEANLSGTQFSLGEIDYRAEGITQAQINMASAYKDKPPQLEGVLDAESGEQLTPPTTEPDFWQKMTELAERSER